VIGVVVGEASLGLLATSGALPQNVNFAIRGEIAQIFLTARGIKVLTTRHRQALSTEGVASQGLRSTVQVMCTIE
jgi:serine protease Do